MSRIRKQLEEQTIKSSQWLKHPSDDILFLAKMKKYASPLDGQTTYAIFQDSFPVYSDSSMAHSTLQGIHESGLLGSLRKDALQLHQAVVDFPYNYISSLMLPTTDESSILSSKNVISDSIVGVREEGSFVQETIAMATYDDTLMMMDSNSHDTLDSDYLYDDSNVRLDSDVLFELLIMPLLNEDGVSLNPLTLMKDVDVQCEYSVAKNNQRSGGLSDEISIHHRCDVDPTPEAEFISTVVTEKHVSTENQIGKGNESDGSMKKEVSRYEMLQARREMNRESARRCNERAKREKEELARNVEMEKQKVCMLRERDMRLRKENIKLRKQLADG